MIEFDLFVAEGEHLIVGETPDGIITWGFPSVLPALRFVRKWSRDRRVDSEVVYGKTNPRRYRKFVFTYEGGN